MPRTRQEPGRNQAAKILKALFLLTFCRVPGMPAAGFKHAGKV